MPGNPVNLRAAERRRNPPRDASGSKRASAAAAPSTAAPSAAAAPSAVSPPLATGEPAARGELAPPSPSALDQFAQALLTFYRERARKLPWRDNPTAYGVWVSEMMLQQTQVATVLPYYERWMRRFPTVEALAAAPQADVLGLWQGLGYYARARALHAGAQHVLRVYDGALPREAQELQKLPGIGPYTAGAISSIAFEQPAPLVDGNVIRVLCRYFGLFGSPMHQPLKSYLWELARSLIPGGRARDFNQALMEFGATCCTPKAPLCLDCPLSRTCYARTNDAVQQLPELPQRPKTTRIVNVAALVRQGNRVLVGQLPDDAPRWASMWQFPNRDLLPGEAEEAGVIRALHEWCGVEGTVGKRLKSLQHSVTRYRITVHLYEVEMRGEPRPAACRAVAFRDANGLGDLAMPAAHRKLAGQSL